MQTEGAFIVKIIESPAHEVTVVDVILGSLGVAGAMTVIAVILGAVLGSLLILRSRRRGVQQGEHPPSIQPFNSSSPTLGS